MEPQFFDTDLPFRYHPVMINPYAIGRTIFWKWIGFFTIANTGK